MKQKYVCDGKIRKCDVLPQGYYVFDREMNLPRLVDKNYEGFRIVWQREEAAKRLDIHVIKDSIEVLSHSDGKMYTSKKKYYDSLKEVGSHVVEAGEFGKKREIQGDFNARRELKQALQQHLGRI